MHRHTRSLLVVSLLTVYIAATATSVARASITFDELGHLTGGFSVWLTGDNRLFPQNGQLPQRWAALPLVMLGYQFPSLDQEAWHASDLERLGHQFLFEIGNDHHALLWTARLTMIPLGVILAAVCYAWAQRLFGVAGGLVALAAFVLSPSMLAHGPLATSDMTAALWFTVSLGCFWHVLHRCSPLRLLGSGVALGLVFVTKMSAIVMVPVAAILVLARIYGEQPLEWSATRSTTWSGRRQLVIASLGICLAHVLVALIVIWAFYGFRGDMFHADSIGGDRRYLGETLDTIADGVVARPLILAAREWGILPESYLFGFAHVLDRSGRFLGFLNGRYRIGGWWWFFPYTWMVKTPIGLFILLALAAAYGCRALAETLRVRARLWAVVYPIVPLVTFVAVYWSTAIMSDLNIGERHLLPAYPAMFILAGAAGSWFAHEKRRIVGIAGVAIGLLTLSIESAAIWPHYLAHFNQLAGGPRQGYRHLVDSSLDWGQDLPGLQRWLASERQRGLHAPVYLSYFGSGDPAAYDIDVRQIFSYQDWRSDPPLHELIGGTYCVSATMLQSVYTRAPGPWAAPYEDAYQRLKNRQDVGTSRRLVNDFDQLRVARLAAYFRQREPDEYIGYSILVFRLSDDEVRDALDGPPVELMPRVGIEEQ